MLSKVVQIIWIVLYFPLKACLVLPEVVQSCLDDPLEACPKFSGQPDVVCGLGLGRTCPHNHHYLPHCGWLQSRPGWTAAVESNSSICIKCLFSLGNSWVFSSGRTKNAGLLCPWLLYSGTRCQPGAQLLPRIAPLKRLHQVLSALPESWIACVGRANSSTWHWVLHTAPHQPLKQSKVAGITLAVWCPAPKVTEKCWIYHSFPKCGLNFIQWLFREHPWPHMSTLSVFGSGHRGRTQGADDVLLGSFSKVKMQTQM